MDYRYYLTKDWSAEYDCWAFVREVFERERGIKLPLSGIDPTSLRACIQTLKNSPHRKLFEKLDAPRHLCIVEMGREYGSHVGVYCVTPQGCYVMHNSAGQGVALQKPEHLNIPIRGYYDLRSI